MFDDVTDEEKQQLDLFGHFIAEREKEVLEYFKRVPICPVVESYEASKKNIFDEYGRATPSFPTAKPKVETEEKKFCYHDWVLYRGLNFDDYYCTRCSETKPVDPTK